MASGFQKKHVRAAIETLRNIAAQVRDKAVRDLKHDDALAEALGYDERETENLAVWQRAVANALRTDGSKVTILAKHLAGKDVGGVLGITLQRATGDEWEEENLEALIEQAKGEI